MAKNSITPTLDYKIYTVLMTVAIPHYGYPESPIDVTQFIRLDPEALMLGYEELETKLS